MHKSLTTKMLVTVISGRDFVFYITDIRFDVLETKQNPQNRDNEHPHVIQL